MVKKPGLGKGLDMLLSSANKPADAPNKDEDSLLKKIPVEQIQKGAYQPRQKMDAEALQSLADSIKAQGLVQPVVLRKLGRKHYELIAGERRWRAAQLAGLHEIPSIIKDIPDQAVAAMSLIENIQREDLNPLEEASAMERLIEEFGLTHQQTANAVGKSRSNVSNLLRLLALEDKTKGLLDDGLLEMGHARALLSIGGGKQIEAAQVVAKRGLSVRDTERLVKRLLANNDKSPGKAAVKAPEVEKLEQNIGERLGANVHIRYNNKGRGKLTIEYNSLDELDGILDHIK
ncbi:MAG: Chromosome (plasmid) partitioning protein ParB [uncultured Thiotrichaceae bacterium]|uniref:Probable chromosome-partitioning protein ParB n=1 Tax=uncultured Thiotrichaceae bacterium TaxID=298394 RepID=A0A6S6UC60_9GAMM|nr:MAG: Chromosome (plasmid) partitioning protein ParB [uncultured Thiotrichaceae bacterium]